SRSALYAPRPEPTGGYHVASSRRLPSASCCSPPLPRTKRAGPPPCRRYHLCTTAIAVSRVFGIFLLLTYYFQVVLGYSPLKAGLAFLPLRAQATLSTLKGFRSPRSGFHHCYTS